MKGNSYMKKVIILGASGNIARHVTDILSTKEDIQLTLFHRSKNRLRNKNVSKSSIIEGDVLDYDQLKEAIRGQDIVYVNLAGDLETMARNIVNAMKETGVRRIIAISSIGIYETPAKPVLKPYRKLADAIEASSLDYTILRPTWFTNVDERTMKLLTKVNLKKVLSSLKKVWQLLLLGLLRVPKNTAGRTWE